MQLVNVDSLDHPLFAQCWELYESAFPAEERRVEWYQSATMESEYYHFDAIFDGELFVGIVGWWSFPTTLYIEHFAVRGDLRNGGYGRRTLDLFAGLSRELERGVILEVEQPNDDLQRRRIEFYRREGYVLNPHHYTHLPYVGDQEVELLIMSYPTAITESDLSQFKESYFPLIHFRHFK